MQILFLFNKAILCKTTLNKFKILYQFISIKQFCLEFWENDFSIQYYYYYVPSVCVYVYVPIYI